MKKLLLLLTCVTFILGGYTSANGTVPCEERTEQVYSRIDLKLNEGYIIKDGARLCREDYLIYDKIKQIHKENVWDSTKRKAIIEKVEEVLNREDLTDKQRYIVGWVEEIFTKNLNYDKVESIEGGVLYTFSYVEKGYEGGSKRFGIEFDEKYYDGEEPKFDIECSWNCDYRTSYRQDKQGNIFGIFVFIETEGVVGDQYFKMYNLSNFILDQK